MSRKLFLSQASQQPHMRGTRYAGPMTSAKALESVGARQAADAARDPLAAIDAVLAARRRPMSERLELALSWNAVAAELRCGLAAATRQTKPLR